MRVTWLVRLYPRAWRARYEDEARALLDQHVATHRTVVDLLRGIVEARLDPVFRLGGSMPPAQRARATAVTVFALFPLYLLTTWAWLIGSDSPHDNELLDAFQRSDAVARVTQVLTMGGLLLVCASLVVGALLIAYFRSRPDLPVVRSPWGMLALVAAAVLCAGLVLGVLRLLLVLPLFFILPFVPLALPVSANDAADAPAVARSRAGRAMAPAVAGALLLVVSLLAVLGAVLRDGHLSREQTLARLGIYVAVIAIPCGLFALPTLFLRGTPVVAGHHATEQLTRLVLVPIAAATAGMLATLGGAVAWTARAWSLPFDGIWHPGIAAEIGAMASVTAVAVVALARAGGAFASPRRPIV